MTALLSAAVLVALAGCGSAAVPLPPAAMKAEGGAAPVEQGPIDPKLTGVPAGTRLAPSQGLRITTPGKVVSGLDVDGCVDVLADDVTIRDTRIRCSEDGREKVVEVAGGAQRLVVESSEIDGRGKIPVGIGWGDYTLRRVNVHGVVDGARFGHRVVVEESWIHDMARLGSLHPDAMQTTSASDVVIRRNVLDPTREDPARGGGKDYNNAALMLGSETGSREVRDVIVEQNLLGGGNYSLNVRGDITASSVIIRDNVFTDDARYGPVLTPSSLSLAGGNTMESSGDPVAVDRADTD